MEVYVIGNGMVRGLKEGRTDGWMEGRKDGRMEGWKDGRKDGRKEGWKDGAATTVKKRPHFQATQQTTLLELQVAANEA